MKNIKKYLISILSIIGSLILLTLILTTMYHFNYISTGTYKIFKISIIILTLMINSIILGRSSIKNGYLDGIKLGLLLIVFCFLVSIIEHNISIKLILYNIIILITTTLGSMIGINTKKIDKTE